MATFEVAVTTSVALSQTGPGFEPKVTDSIKLAQTVKGQVPKAQTTVKIGQTIDHNIHVASVLNSIRITSKHKKNIHYREVFQRLKFQSKHVLDDSLVSYAHIVQTPILIEQVIGVNISVTRNVTTSVKLKNHSTVYSGYVTIDGVTYRVDQIYYRRNT